MMADFYVDLSAGAAGNGSFATPWNRLSLISGVVGGADKVWARRVTFVDTTITHQGWIPPNNVPVIGWPIVGDEDYATRPVAAQAAWDGDVGTHAALDITDPNHTALQHRYTVAIGTSVAILKRLSVTYNVTSGVNPSYIHSPFRIDTLAPGALSLYRCIFRFMPIGAFSISPSQLNGAYTSVAGCNGILPFNIRECTFETAVSTGTGIGGVICHSASGAATMSPGFSDCTFIMSGQSTAATWIPNHGTAQHYWNGNFVRCAFIASVARSSAAALLTGSMTSYDGATTNMPLFVDCTFSSVPSSTPGYNHLDLVQERFVRCSGTGINSLKISGRARAHFTSWVQGGVDTAALGAVELYEEGLQAVFDNLVLLPGNTKDIYSPPGRQSAVCARQITEGTGGYYAVYGEARILLANLNNTVGTWKYILPEGTLETSANARVGGEAFSVVMKPAGGGGQAPASAAIIGLRSALPGEDTVFVSLAAGARTVTVFGYYGGYTTVPTKATVWLDVEYATSSGFAVATSKATGAVTADASTWGGFSGGTPFKMAVTFTPPADCVGAVRITSTAFDSSTAYIAIDPKPVVI